MEGSSRYQKYCDMDKEENYYESRVTPTRGNR